MGDIFELSYERMHPIMRSGDLASCMDIAAETLHAMPTTPFHRVLDLAITNEPAKVARFFDDFFRQESKRFAIVAAYTETNGFDINTDRWFFDPFAYNLYGGHDDYDWLSDWQSGQYDSMTITGLEGLQGVYADWGRTGEYPDAQQATDFLVILKFQDLIRRSAPLMKELRFPLLATSHDYDFIYEVRPVA